MPTIALSLTEINSEIVWEFSSFAVQSRLKKRPKKKIEPRNICRTVKLCILPPTYGLEEG